MLRGPMEAEVTGSSPLARGTRHRRPVGDQRRRFIPAGAGNATALARTRSITAVHPRWRGEREAEFDFDDQQIGSSPLARGTLAAAPGAALGDRFIPAGAGNAVTVPETG